MCLESHDFYRKSLMAIRLIIELNHLLYEITGFPINAHMMGPAKLGNPKGCRSRKRKFSFPYKSNIYTDPIRKHETFASGGRQPDTLF